MAGDVFQNGGVTRVQDALSLYPYLQEIRQLCPDENDMAGETPPYAISPCDISSYYSPASSSPTLKISGRQLTMFEVIELNRQLYFWDKKDGCADGNVSPEYYNEEIVLLPYIEPIWEWGRGWTPITTLLSFLNAYKNENESLLKDVEWPYERAKDSANDAIKAVPYYDSLLFGEDEGDKKVKSKKPRIERNALDPDDVDYLKGLAAELEKNGDTGYARLIRRSIDKIAILDIRPDLSIQRSVAFESSEFGHVHLFDVPGKPAIELIRYPQLQSHFFRPRCGKEKGSGKRTCLPFVGKNTFEDSTLYYLRPYYRGEDMAVPDEKGRPSYYKLPRMPDILKHATIYNSFKYDMEEFKQDQDFKIRPWLQTMHEVKHLEHRKLPFGLGDISNSMAEILSKVPFGFSKRNIEESLKRSFGRSLSWAGKILLATGLYRINYHTHHLAGYYLTDLQRKISQKYLITEEERNYRKDDLMARGEDFETDPLFNELAVNLKYLHQSMLLANAAEERMIEDEVYELKFGKYGLKEFQWATEEERFANPNEIEVLKIVKRRMEAKIKKMKHNKW